MHRALGVSAYCLLFGREPRLPRQLEIVGPIRGRTRSITEYLDELRSNLSALHRLVLEQSAKSHARNKQVYDKKINEFSYAPGDTIYLHKAVVPKGQYYKFLRPWKSGTVIDKVGPLNYRIKLDGAKSTLLVHHNRLKPRSVVSNPSDGPVPVGIDSQRSDPVPRGAERAVGVDGNSVSGGGFQCNGLSESGRSTESVAGLEEPLAPIVSLLSPFAIPFVPSAASVSVNSSKEGGGRQVVESGSAADVPSLDSVVDQVSDEVPSLDSVGAVVCTDVPSLNSVGVGSSVVPPEDTGGADVVPPVDGGGANVVLVPDSEGDGIPIPTPRRSTRSTRGQPPARLIENS